MGVVVVEIALKNIHHVLAAARRADGKFHFFFRLERATFVFVSCTYHLSASSLNFICRTPDLVV